MDTHDIAIAAAIVKGSGGGGGTGNYNLLENKPKINNVELVGNKSLDDIGVSSAIQTEVARIVADAPEDFDTLKEMSDWIATHEDDAAAMNSAIRQNASDISDLEDTKVDKVSGKGLSTNDYTTAEKTKLAGLSNYDDTQVQSDITNLNTNKADKSTTYTKAETDALLKKKVDKEPGKGLSAENFTAAEKTKLAGLSNYDDTQVRADIEALESSRYTKAETDALLKKKQDTLTSTQLAAVNSGITAAKVGQYDDIYAVMNYDVLNHNGIFRGEDLTNAYTIEQMYAMIHSGKFDDLFLGDYFTKSITTDIYTHFTGAEFDSGTTYYEMDGTINDRTWTETSDTEPQSGKTYATKLTKTENVTLMFAAFDYYYNMGDTALTTHHAVLIPKTFFATTAKINPTNTTAGGYYSSDMHQITLPCYAKSLKTALGNHLLAHKTWLTTTVNTSTPSMAGAGMTGAASASAWKTTELQLMNEVQLYGSTVWSSSAYDVGVDNEKLPVFNFINPVHFGRNAFWLRSVVSSADFAYCTGYGHAHADGASYAIYVRPLILFG